MGQMNKKKKGRGASLGRGLERSKLQESFYSNALFGSV
ncbi:hypothetical protein LEP1GSC083_5341 [Leptospira interrogans serovar Pyrogenes str. L0374]|uniref:Uncharacterized protein n=1 Tax=Leptospira interrogans serovar Pyrogenes str. L0374 TaxID=1049928 RepID=M6KS89_LEPIR|nr:hypothetical protein LEP1GSC083_5341 [Leptospira interrogans serovar Pyrogenes str. L0374]